jgi:hypothetical protein
MMWMPGTNPGEHEGVTQMATKTRAARNKSTEATGYTDPESIEALGTMVVDGRELTLVIYRRTDGQFTHAAAKVAGGGGALLRLAAAVEDRGHQVELGRDRVGNRTMWLETERDLNGMLGMLQEVAAGEGWL